jgi:hypothetical protein
MTHISEISTPSESLQHKAIKQLVFKYIRRYNRDVIESSCEKYLDSRRGDVYFKLRTGEEIVVEVQNSRISVREVLERMKDYTKKGIYVLWILSGSGNAGASEKAPIHKKNIKISPVEFVLHKINRGRVYYVSIRTYKDKITLTPPYALHFSPSDSKTRTIFKEGFSYYYIRNANVVKIPSWSLPCADYTFKVARFYDKNAATILKRDLWYHIQKQAIRLCDNCRKRFKFLRRCTLGPSCDFRPYQGKALFKRILSQFGGKYGKYMIIQALKSLNSERNIPISKKIIIKY